MSAGRTPDPQTWRPILEGAAAEQARAAIAAIAAILGANLPSLDDAPADCLARLIFVEAGRAGLALFFAYLARANGDRTSADVAERYLDEAIAWAPRTALALPSDISLSLSGGFAGLALVIERLRRLGISTPAGEELCRATDERLLAELDRPPDPAVPDDYDLLYGLVGRGVYALDRLSAPTATPLLAAVVDRLAARAERRPDGITWWTPPAHIDRADEFPHGRYNLGLAHGVPGVVGFLGLVCAAGIATATVRPLLDGAVAWRLAQRLDHRPGPSFRHYVGTGIKPRPPRLAWCYGDPGVAAALLVAARAVGRPDWEREAIGIALHAADAPPEACGIVDAPFCHGALGVGHLFNRLVQATGRPRLAETARFWLERGLAMRRPGGKLGGFHALVADGSGRPTRRVAFRRLLIGSAGIGLALLAATTDVEPAWDRFFLLS